MKGCREGGRGCGGGVGAMTIIKGRGPRGFLVDRGPVRDYEKGLLYSGWTGAPHSITIYGRCIGIVAATIGGRVMIGPWPW